MLLPSVLVLPSELPPGEVLGDVLPLPVVSNDVLPEEELPVLPELDELPEGVVPAELSVELGEAL